MLQMSLNENLNLWVTVSSINQLVHVPEPEFSHFQNKGT